MKKIKKYSLVSTLLMFPLLLGCVYFYNSIRIPNAIAIKKLAIKFPDKYEEYKTVKCNLFDFINPEYAFIAKRPERDHEIFFFKVAFSNVISKEIRLNYTGGTDVKNTNFDELVKMVKEDCPKFQKGYGDYYGEDLAWSYSPYVPEPPKTQDEIDFEKRKEEWLKMRYEEKVASGEIDDPTFESAEEALRYNGIPEEEIKRMIEGEGAEYIGPQ